MTKEELITIIVNASQELGKDYKCNIKVEANYNYGYDKVKYNITEYCG